MKQLLKSFLLSIIVFYFIFELLLGIKIIDTLTTYTPNYINDYNLIKGMLTDMVSFSIY